MARPSGYDRWSPERKSRYWAGRRKERSRHEDAVKRRRAYVNDPARVTEPLDPRKLRERLESATRLRYGGEERELQGQRAVSEEMQRRTGNWYENYRQDIARAQAGQAQYASQQQQQMAARLQATQQAAQTGQQQVNQQAQASAAQRGATVDPALAAQAQQAAASRQAASGSFQNLLSTLSTAEQARLGQQGIAAGASQLAAHTAEGRRRRSIDESGRELEREKGDFRTQERERLRENERRYLLEREAFGLSVEKERADQATERSKARDRRSDNRRQEANEQRRRMEADRKYRLDEEKFGRERAKDNYQRRHGLGPYKESKPKARKPSSDDLKGRRAITDARRMWRYEQKRGRGQKTPEQRFREGARRNNVSPIIAEAARQMETQGYIGPNTARRLREEGVRVPRSWTKRKPRTRPLPNRPPHLR